MMKFLTTSTDSDIVTCPYSALILLLWCSFRDHLLLFYTLSFGCELSFDDNSGLKIMTTNKDLLAKKTLLFLDNKPKLDSW